MVDPIKTVSTAVCGILLLSYHRRLRMISEVLELRVKSRRVGHSWCMCVISNGYCGLGGAWIKVVDGMHT